MTRFGFVLALSVLTTAAAVPSLRAGEASGEMDGGDSSEIAVDGGAVFDSLVVTGGAELVESIPGSATFIGIDELEQHDHSDLHRILRQVPGVNVQDEEGFGLRPNIGMRGTGVERSAKITLLEDGVLIAPAPYSAPAAYYVPTAGRMDALEVRKGSSSISQGPYTNGGVINLVSHGIPDSFSSGVNVALGEHETLRLKADVGSSSERFGWMLQTYRLDSEGFKELDGGGSTGVGLEDYLAKLRFGTRTDADVYQAAELKFSITDQFGDETYLGLTGDDFSRTPYRRYAASQRDYLDTEHEQFQLRYFVQPTARLRLTATAYRNDFFRNWHKGQSVAGVGLSSVVDSPDQYVSELALLRGEIDDVTGAIRIRNNRRDYLSEGLDLTGEYDLSVGSVDHALEFGLRLHSDQEDRFQEEDSWNMIDGFLRGEVLGVPGSQSNRVSSADATAVYVRDDIRLGRWTLNPGLRVEDIDFERLDYGRADPVRSGLDLTVRENGTREVLPGLGVGFEVNGEWLLFGGVHKGFAPPGPGQSGEVQNEESLNYELGFNFRGQRLGARVVGFYSDYDNLLGRDTLSVGGDGSGDAFNGGAVEVHGVEALLDYDLGQAADLQASIPLRLSYTYTSAEFQSSFETSFADWAPGVREGDELPYIPEHQLTATAGYVRARWSSYLTVSYTDDTRTEPGSGAIPAASVLERRVVSDLAVDFQAWDRLALFAQIRNVTDEVYLAARRPHGARPGSPRTSMLGLKWNLGR